MAHKNKHLHLTFEERKIIEKSIENGASKTDIANVLGKDKSTIGKEIKLHREEKTYSIYPVDCTCYARCHRKNTYGCGTSCQKYKAFTCTRRDRSPGACNGCTDFKRCHYLKYLYRADKADMEYRKLLVETRIGIATPQGDLETVGKILKPLLKKGQSLYTICNNHPEIKLSERTLYNYIESGVFRAAGIDISVLDLRMQVRRKPPRRYNTVVFKERIDRKHLIGRTHADYLQFKENNPFCHVVQMDTVYNDGSNGPYIQTFKFLSYGFLFCVFHSVKNSDAMRKGIDLLELILGNNIFQEEVQAILTDRGTEFMAAEAFETGRNGNKRTRLFYCDPMCSHQKGSLENNHLELRYICPKDCNLFALGLTDQEKMNRVTSNINSVSKKRVRRQEPFSTYKLLQP